MKNKLRWLYLTLEALFLGAIPVCLVWMQYAENEAISNSYKLSITGIVVLMFAFLLVRKIFIKPELEKWNQKIVNLETTSYSISSPEALEKARKEWKTLSLLQLGIDSIIPILLFVLALFTIKAVEDAVLKLYGVLCICGASLLCGLVTRIFEISSNRFKCEEATKKLEDKK